MTSLRPAPEDEVTSPDRPAVRAHTRSARTVVLPPEEPTEEFSTDEVRRVFPSRGGGAGGGRP